LTLVDVLCAHPIFKNNGTVVVVLSVRGSIDVLVPRTPPLLVEVLFCDGCDGFLVDELFDVVRDGFHGPRLVPQLGVESLYEICDHGVYTHAVQPEKFQFSLGMFQNTFNPHLKVRRL